MVQGALAGRKGRLEQMTTDADGRVRLEYVLPVRGLIGYRGQLLTDTRGTALLHQIGEGYGPWAGEVTHRTNGVLVADRAGTSNAYGLFNLQERSELFIGAGEEVYEGMIVGENSRSGDMDVNATKEKKLTNIRTHAHDEALRLTPPRPLTLESAIEFIGGDELVEVTPSAIRLRKRLLAQHDRDRERGREYERSRAGAMTAAEGTLNAVTGLERRERVRAFDLAAGLSVFFMILVHVLWHWGRPETWTGPIGETVSYLAGPTAAPVFAFLMGASLGAAPRTSFGSMAARGLWLVFLGYVLNFLRGVIPATLGLRPASSPPRRSPRTTPGGWRRPSTCTTWSGCRWSPRRRCARASNRTGSGWVSPASLVLIAPPVRTFVAGTPLLDAPLTPILGSAPNVYYAVIPWLAFPLGARCSGAAMARSPTGAACSGARPPSGGAARDRRRAHRDRAAGLRRVHVLADADLVRGGDLRADPRVARAVRAGDAAAAWWTGDFGVVYAWSDRIIAMYFAHWIIVGWGVGLVGLPRPHAGAGAGRDGRGRRRHALPLEARGEARVQLVGPARAGRAPLRGRGRDPSPERAGLTRAGA